MEGVYTQGATYEIDSTYVCGMPNATSNVSSGSFYNNINTKWFHLEGTTTVSPIAFDVKLQRVIVAIQSLSSKDFVREMVADYTTIQSREIEKTEKDLPMIGYISKEDFIAHASIRS